MVLRRRGRLGFEGEHAATLVRRVAGKVCRQRVEQGARELPLVLLLGGTRIYACVLILVGPRQLKVRHVHVHRRPRRDEPAAIRLRPPALWRLQTGRGGRRRRVVTRARRLRRW